MQSQTEPISKEWAPGWRKHVPWVAISCLIGFALCCVALAAILWSSDNREITAWPVPVSVFLALIVSIANLCLSVALSKGYEISWWLRAVNGAELRHLQFDLEIQHHLSALLGRNTRVDIFATAAIISLVVSVFDGPVIQRASTVAAITFQPVDFYDQINVSKSIFPANFSGYEGTRIRADLLVPLSGNISRAYTLREDVLIPIDACKSVNTTCVLTLPAPGFDVSCEERFVDYDFDSLEAADPRHNTMTVFNITIPFGWVDELKEYTTIRTRALVKHTPACAGQMMLRECTLRLGTNQYPVTIRDGIATVDRWQFGQNETIEITTHGFGVKNWNPGTFSVEDGSAESAYEMMPGGVHLVLEALYASEVSLRFVGRKPYAINAQGQSASNYLSSDISTYGDCTMAWTDPTADMVNTVREFMFRSALAFADYNRSAVVPQQIKIRKTKVAAAYQSHYEYLGIAVACMLLQALVISFLLYGWHRLGREVSLDAFEVARAMGAPVLQGGSSNSRIDLALATLRHDLFRYGEFTQETADPCTNGNQSQRNSYEASLNKPWQYDILDNDRTSDDEADKRPRLGLDRAERVRSIRRGVLY